MMLYWAEWTHTETGGQRWSDDPPDRIYHGSEPIPDTPMIVEQMLGYMRQTSAGHRCCHVLETHYLYHNRPIVVRCQELCRRWKALRSMSQSTYYSHLSGARVVALDTMQRIKAGATIDLKQMRGRNRM